MLSNLSKILRMLIEIIEGASLIPPEAYLRVAHEGDQKVDMVNHPPHYTFGKFEVIDVLMDWFSDKPLLWQVVKYVARAFHKENTIEDLKKARFYLDKQIELLEVK